MKSLVSSHTILENSRMRYILVILLATFLADCDADFIIIAEGKPSEVL